MARFPARFNVSRLDGTKGFVLYGEAPQDQSGACVSSAGDVNGDGFDDILVGAPSADPHGYGSGAAYVIFGHAGAFPKSLGLASLNGRNGFKLSGSGQFARTGYAASAAGDVNGDGLDDIIVGASNASPHGANSGAAYVVFGRKGVFFKALDLAALSGRDGFRLNGGKAGDFSGNHVSAAGDVNGDGIDDLLVGAAGTDIRGESSGTAYVVFGHKGGFAKLIDLAKLDGKTGFRLDGGHAYDNAGRAVSAAGDVNGDGFDDVLVGSVAQPKGIASGESYLVYGHKGAFARSIDLSTLDGKNGTVIEGADTMDNSGKSVSAGDINGDGLSDLIIGATVANVGENQSGAAFVVFGHKGGLGQGIDLANLDGKIGFRLNGVSSGDNTGFSVGSAGDVNGDGFDDLVIGAPAAPAQGKSFGAVYVVFGHSGGFAKSIDLGKLNGSNGFRVDGAAEYDRIGYWVKSAGDVNGDGFSDLVFGAIDVDGLGGVDAGASFVVFGRAPSGPVKLSGTAASQTLAGGAGKDMLSGGGGDDRLYGNEGKDTLTGGAGDDVFVFRSGLGKSNADAITDFTHDHDRIALDSTVFKGLKQGAVSAKAFYAKAFAHEADDRVLYDKKTGALFYDSDGNVKGGHAAVQFATLDKGLTLDAGDFLVI